MSDIADRMSGHVRESARNGTLGRKILIGSGALVALMTAWGTSYQVERNEIAVITRFGAVEGTSGPGLHFKLPFVESANAVVVSTRAIGMDKAEAFTIDNQPLFVDFIIQFVVPVTEAARVYTQVPDYERRLGTMALDRMKIEFGRRNIADVPSQRGVIRDEVLRVVRTEATRLYGIDVQDIQLVNIEYSQAFRAAVDKAAVAKAGVEQAEQEKRRAEVEAQRVRVEAEGQAQAEIARARGAAEAKKLQADAEAISIRVRGEAEASSIKAQTEALAQNPAYVALRQAERWNGQLPSQLLGGAPVPFLNIEGKPR